MERLGWLLLAIGLAYGLALVVPLSGRWSRRRSPTAAGWCVAIGALACPLLIPSELVGHRALAAVISTDIAFKVVDFLRQHPGAWDGRVSREFRRALVPFPIFSVVHRDRRRRPPHPDATWLHVRQIVTGAAVAVAGVVLARMLSATAAARSSPAIDHVVRVAAFIPTIESISRVLHGIERLAGFDARPIVRHAYRSRTVAEFWRRFNGRMHDWYRLDVFARAGGGHAPARATVLTFLVSGLHHELMFGIATSRFTGYQLAFFLVQAPAVLASGRLASLAGRGGLAGECLSRGVTIAFLTATSVLFFHGVGEVFPSILVNGSPLP